MSLHIEVHQLVETEDHVYFCACSPDTKLIACALGSGVICILKALTVDIVTRGTPGKDFAGVPATCIRWLPTQDPANCQLVSASCAGGIMLWNLDTVDTTLKRGVSVSEDKNEVMTVDVSPSGKLIISAGSDRVIRLYNEALQLLSKLVNGVNTDGTARPTHTNRVFSARFLTESLAVSAGWESPVQLWDLRSRCSNRQVVGVDGSSDCLEPVTGTHLVLVASPKAADTLQLFDSVTGRLIDENSKKTCSELEAQERVVACRFSSETGHVWCLTVSPPSLIVLSLSSGHVFARAPLPAQPLNIVQRGTGALVGCKDGVILQASLSM